MTKNKLIENINSSDIMCAFVEIGAGIPVATAFLDYPEGGGSQTVFSVKSPYHKMAQKHLYVLENTRSVSFEFCKTIIESEWENTMNNWRNYHSALNTVFTSTFQIGPDVCNHGWIGIRYKNAANTNYFHFTFSKQMTKTDIIEKIQLIGLRLLWWIAEENRFLLELPFLDCIKNQFGEDQIQRLLNTSTSEYKFIKANSSPRLEELVRTQEQLIVYKGSFNPIHQGHIEILNKTQESFPASNTVFSISSSTFGKGYIQTSDLINRINQIHCETGKGVLVFDKPLFLDNYFVLRRQFPSMKLIFPMGLDTYERIDNNDLAEMKNTVILVFDRGNKINREDSRYFGTSEVRFVKYNNPISSTALRQQLT